MKSVCYGLRLFSDDSWQFLCRSWDENKSILVGFYIIVLLCHNTMVTTTSASVNECCKAFVTL